jgi:hypothetical protein
MDVPFELEAPDLREGGEWCEARLDKLRATTEGEHDQYFFVIDAQRLLASHHLKYTFQGDQRMETLWWEFPP